MNTRLNNPRAWAVTVVSSILWLAAPALGDASYSLTYIARTFPAPTLSSSILNNAGQVVGVSSIPAHGFLWEDGLWTDLGPDMKPVDINDTGQIVGSVVMLNKTFLWQNGRFTILEDQLGTETFPVISAINNVGQIVGQYSSYGTRPALSFLLQDGVLRLENDWYFQAINDGEQIVSTLSSTGGRAYLWEDGWVTYLNGLTLNYYNAPYYPRHIINTAGQVIGYYGQQAVLWQNGELIDLGYLGVSSLSANAYAINDLRQIVGESDERAFLWENGEMIDLNDLLPIDPASDTLSKAVDINENGQILGVGSIGGQEGLFLLTPIPVLPGDANGDGLVSADDYASVQANFGNTGAPGTSLLGDTNQDRVVSADDYASVQSHFGATAGMGSIPVPEPATLGLLALGGLAILRRRSQFVGSAIADQ